MQFDKENLKRQSKGREQSLTRMSSTGDVGTSFPQQVSQTIVSQGVGNVIPHDEAEEIVPLRLNESSDINSAHVDEKNIEVPGFTTRIKHDAVYKENVFVSFSICWSFFVLGWVIGQIGPALPELQIITGSPLEKASAFLTAGATGYMAGSLLSGVLFDRFNKHLLVFSFTFCGFVTFLVIPWCYSYGLMVVVQFCRGVFGGGLDAGGNTLLVWTWGGDERSFMQAIHFAFALGGIISPMVIVPFLSNSDSRRNVTDSLIIDPDFNISGHQLYENMSGQYSEHLKPVYNIATSLPTTSHDVTTFHSQLYLDFLITSALHLSCAVPFFILYIRARRQNRRRKENKTKETLTPAQLEIGSNWKVFVLGTICLFLGLNAALENTFNYLLVTFCLRQMNWSKVQGSFATSLFWATFGAGRFLGIWLIKLFDPAKLIGVFTVSIGLVFLALVAFSYLMIDAGIWACAVSAGAAMSIIFPTVFTWTNESLVPMTGKVASLFLISASCGAMFNPILLGYIMETFSPLWFAYMLFGDSIAAIVVYIILLFLARKLANLHKEVRVTAKQDTREDEKIDATVM